MKTVIYTLSGQPQEGDRVILRYRSPRGGSTHVMHRCTAADSPASLASILADEMDKGWMKEAFEVKAKGNRVIVQCTGLVADVIFEHEIEGSAGLKVALEEI
jgi:hypothetical protein